MITIQSVDAKMVLKGNKRLFILEPNMSAHGLGTQIWVTPSSIFQPGISFMKIFTVTKEVTNQGGCNRGEVLDAIPKTLSLLVGGIRLY